MPKVIKGGGGPSDRPSSEGSPAGPDRYDPRRSGAASSLSGAPRPKNRVIGREVVGASQEARRIVEQAEAEAERILDAAREEAEAMHRRGFEQGRAEGKAALTEQLTRGLSKLRKIEEQLEVEYVGLVRACVEKVLDRELQLAPEAVIGVVRNALRDARQQREVMVRVHPADAELLEGQQARLLEVLARASVVEVRADPSVTRGGCVVATELGTIDATLERQLEALEAALATELGDAGFDRFESELDVEDDPGFGR